jgi:arabinose-5-phosphate isomerase
MGRGPDIVTTNRELRANPEDLARFGREVVEREAAALHRLAEILDGEFSETIRVLHETIVRGGRILVTGIGKSGLVGRKFASTLCSTGAPAIFVHPAEAAHGDLGLITDADALVAISRSGDVESLAPVLSTARRLGVPVLAWTSAADSALAAEGDVTLVLDVGAEADPDDLIPSVSSTATMALGDAVAIALFRARGLQAEDFARLHPGGALGRRLTMRVRDLMRSGDELPIVVGDRDLLSVLQTISEKRLGIAIVTDEAGRLEGVLTDGDVRRALLADRESLHRPVRMHMTRDPRTIAPDELIARSIQRMEQRSRRITSLVVVEDGRPVGVLHLHDCLEAGLR